MMATGRFEHLITRAADHPKKLLLNQLTLCLRNRLCRRRAARLALRDQPDTAAAMVLGRPLPDGGTAAVMFRPQQVGSASQPARRWWGRTRGVTLLGAVCGVPVFLSLTL